MLIARKVLWLCVNSLKCLAECGAKVPQNVAKKKKANAAHSSPLSRSSPLLFINEA